MPMTEDITASKILVYPVQRHRVPAQSDLYFLQRRPEIALEQRLHRHQHARCAISALQRSMLQEETL